MLVDMPCTIVTAAAAAAAQWPRASLEFCGLEKEMQEKLIGEPPIQTIILEQAVATAKKKNHVIVRLTYPLIINISPALFDSRDHGEPRSSQIYE